MSKEGRVRGSAVPSEESSSAPYSTRREKSRKLAQKRRDTYKQIMDDLTSVLPFPKEAVSQLDYNSRLRLALCFFRLKTMVENNSEMSDSDVQSPPGNSKQLQIVKRKTVSDSKPVLFQPGMLQDLMTEALDGFLMVTQVDGTIVFLSESVHKYLGLFQSENIGMNMFDLIHEDDHAEVRSKVSDTELKSLNDKGTAKITFSCRMKCSRYKMANVITKSPGYKLVYVSGTVKMARGEPFIACVVRPVSPPSVLEIRLEGNMFVCRYSIDFTCTYFDGRLRPLLGYTKEDLVGKQPFTLFHHEDIDAIIKCRNKVFEKGESLSGYYRFFNLHGESIWVQVRATLILDSRTGKPISVNCINFIISKEDGDKDLQLRRAIKNGESNIKEESVHSHDPFPVVERADGTVVNPLHEDGTSSAESSPASAVIQEDLLTSSSTEAQSSSSTESPLPESSESSNASPPTMSSSGIGSSMTAAHHHSSSSISSGTVSSANDSVFADGSSPPQEPSTTTTTNVRSQSTSPDGCVPDSTTSNLTSPSGLQQNGNTVSGDMGYSSGSGSSLRDRLMSGESNSVRNSTDSLSSASSLSVSGSVGSLPPHANTTANNMTTSNSEFHSQNTFHPASSFCSNDVMTVAPGNPLPSMAPSNGTHFIQSQPIGGNSFSMHMGTQFGQQLGQGQMSMGNGTPQQFLQQNHMPNGSGVNPANSLPDWIPGPSLYGYAHSGAGNIPFQGGEQMGNFQTMGGPGFQYIEPSLSSTGSAQEVYNPPPITTSGSNTFVGPVPGLSCATPFQVPQKVSTSDLPQLTGEDLKMLDAFEQVREEDRFDQLLSQQAALSCGATAK